MAVEDHPLFPKWKDALEELIRAKERLGHASTATEQQAAREAHGHALARYCKIADEV